MVTIIFESHATTYDNESGLSSGHYDVELSELGKKQAKELGKRYRNENFDAIFSSDLKRSYETAEIAFANRGFSIIRDPRLREVDYGDLTRHPQEEVERLRLKYLTKPFPNGESYEQAVARIKSFLRDLLKDYGGKKIIIIGHRATQYGLEHWINKVSLKGAVAAPWEWQAGWKYHSNKII